MTRRNQAQPRESRYPWRVPNLPRLAAAILLAAAFAYLAILASSTDFSAYEARALRSGSASAEAATGGGEDWRLSEHPAKSRSVR
ncbi:MAG: hypothetical protein ACKO38_09940 [Planctomycetota bacterium]